MTHCLPGNGWQWRPGEGLEIDVNNLGLPGDGQTPITYRVGVALLGYIAVQ